MTPRVEAVKVGEGRDDRYFCGQAAAVRDKRKAGSSKSWPAE